MNIEARKTCRDPYDLTSDKTFFPTGGTGIGLLGGVVALAKEIGGGRISGGIIAHIDCVTSEYWSSRDAAKGLAAERSGMEKRLTDNPKH